MSFQIRTFTMITIVLLLTIVMIVIQRTSGLLAASLSEIKPNETSQREQALSLIDAANPWAPTAVSNISFTGPTPTIEVCGTIDVDTTWAASDGIYLVTCGDLTVSNGVSLTIEPGTIVKFGTDDSLFVDGALRVLGTAAQPIIFTSSRDDSAGGDTNGDGDGSTPAATDWGRVQFNDESNDANSEITHLIIRYSGNDGYSSDNFIAIRLLNAFPTLQNITLENNYINGVQVTGDTWPTDILNDPGAPYYVTSEISLPVNETLTISSGVRVNFWEDVTVANDAQLIIESGVIAKFSFDDSLLVDGTLQVNGTASNPVYFTSYRDDTVGGDSNGNGNATIPSAKDWGRIQFNAGSDDTNSIIEHLVIRYSGNDGNDFGAIRLVNASPTLQNITFANNYINGAEIPGGTWSSAVWQDIGGGAYYITADMIISADATLTIQPNVVVKLTLDDSLFVDGSLRVLGTSTNPVYFTSYKDDSVGGDTNGDGTSNGVVKDWGRIQFSSGSNDTNSIIENLTNSL